MSLEWAIYWITRCDTLRAAFYSIFAASFIIATILIMIRILLFFIDMDTNFSKEDEKTLKICCRRLFFGWFSSLFLAALTGLGWVLTPTTNQMAAIIIIPKIVENPMVNEELKDWKEILDRAKIWLKDQLDPTKETPREEKNDQQSDTKRKNAESTGANK